MDTPAKIREALKADTRSDGEIAAAAGIGRVYLNRFKKGHVTISAAIQDRIAEALGVEIVVKPHRKRK